MTCIQTTHASPVTSWRDDLPPGWTMKVSKAFSPLHDTVMHTCWVYGPDGMSDWLMVSHLDDLREVTLAVIEECRMAKAKGSGPSSTRGQQNPSEGLNQGSSDVTGALSKPDEHDTSVSGHTSGISEV